MRPNRKRRVDYARGFGHVVELPYYRAGRMLRN
nr:MAG: hypothetical protein [Microvirus Sku111]